MAEFGSPFFPIRLGLFEQLADEVLSELRRSLSRVRLRIGEFRQCGFHGEHPFLS